MMALASRDLRPADPEPPRPPDPRTVADDADFEPLFRRAREGDERSIEKLIARYRPLAEKIARRYYLVGHSSEDLRQEALIGLFKAIRSFDPEVAVPFTAFVELCVNRHVVSCVKNANRFKHRPITQAVSLEVLSRRRRGGFTETTPARGFQTQPRDDPERLAISAESIIGIRDFIARELTTLEQDVAVMWADGKSYEEIATQLDSHVKSIDNALQRVRRKLRAHLETASDASSNDGAE